MEKVKTDSKVPFKSVTACHAHSQPETHQPVKFKALLVETDQLRFQPFLRSQDIFKV